MLKIDQADVLKRLQFDNPWWVDGQATDLRYQRMPRRAYFEAFSQRIQDRSVHRAVVLRGPRRVGKTVMVYHAIQDLLNSGVSGDKILYLSIETPLYIGLALERLLTLFLTSSGHNKETELYIFFDEVQYLKDWEVHLKSLVDSYGAYKFVVTGSAAAALRMKSNESGAGRFSSFVLPPLTFAEYLQFTNKEQILINRSDNANSDSHPYPVYETTQIEELNNEFINYLNYGGYPESVLSETVRGDIQQYIKSDIIDKVLLRDLPSLYGISDIQELNKLFTMLAYNTGNELSLDTLAKEAGISKNTISRYLVYLEAAFLITRLERIDQNAKRFKRASLFKVYLTNPSMRAALFGPVEADGKEIGQLTETAIFSQWQHHDGMPLYYARWNTGEVDIVSLNTRTQKPDWAVEVKWSDRPFQHSEMLDNCVELVKNNPGIQQPILVTSRTVSATKKYRDIDFKFKPTSLHVYILGKNILRTKLLATNQAPHVE